MKLEVLNNTIPVKAIPEEKLNTIVLTVFSDWLCGLLSLLGETSAERLEFALPAIKEHCWSMGFDEIKKMFEMYADNKLNIEPIPNYFDRILFGKIVNAYKQQKKVEAPQKSPEEKEREYKALQDQHYVITLFDYWVQHNNVPTDCHWVYTYLEERLEDFRFSDKEKISLYNKGKEQKTLTDEEIKEKCKRILLMRYFAQLHAKGKHIKDIV